MNIGQFKLKINNEDYYFRFSMRAYIALEKKYGNKLALAIYNQYIFDINSDENFIRILTCMCINKRINEKFLYDNLIINKQTLNLKKYIHSMILKDYESYPVDCLKVATNLIELI